MKKSYQLSVIGLLFLLAGCVPAADNTPRAVDPFVAVAQAQGTAEAAQSEANMYAGQLTATAQAPIVAITSTAAAWEMEQRYALATQQAVQQTETAAWTATAMSWTATPNATSTVIAVNALAMQQFTYNDIQRDNLAVEQTRRMNMVYAILKGVGLLLTMLCVVGGLYTAARVFGVRHNQVDPRGNPLPMYDVLDGVAWDIDRSVNGQISTRQNYIKQLPQITAERQDAVTERDQNIDLWTRPDAIKRAQDNLPKSLPSSVEHKKRIEQLDMKDVTGFALPNWSVMDSWDGKNGLPYGVTDRGLQLMSISTHPHIATIGKTGSGKSRRFLRPFLAGALAAGHRVVIVGKGADFHVFNGQPNASLITVRDLTDEQEAARYGMYLRAMVEEMNRRDAYLTESRHSTWEQAGRESTFVVLDELGNALDLMPRELSDMARRYIRGLASEGRKVGFHLVMASQRAVGFRNLMTQVGRAIFFVEDEQESRMALGLPGAERLQDGYFYARFGSAQLTGAFAPSDDEIAAFLQKRSIAPLEPQRWIEGASAGTIQQAEVPLIVPVEDQPRDEIAEMAEKIRSQWSAGMSGSAVARLLGLSQYGGSYKTRIDNVVAYLTSTLYSTTQNAAEMPVLGAVEA